MKRLLPFLLPLIALFLGAGGGAFLHSEPGGEGHEDARAGDEHATSDEGGAAPDYVKLTNQFVIPILTGGEVSSLVILSLSLEVGAGQGEEVYAREPKLRDALLQVMFDHANAGGFNGDFTQNAALAPLRQALREAASAVMGPSVTDVLISDIVRQDG